MTRLPRTLRLDPSDTFVFARPAEPGEWAVTGSFLFLDADPAAMGPKERAAFRAGFAGVASLGFSTLAVVTDATPAERKDAVETLAKNLVERLGAPDLATARAAAEEEIAFAESLCAHPANTVLALRRSLEDGEIREEFRTLTPRERGAAGADRLHAGARAFEFVESDGEGPEERVDLLALMKGEER